VHGSGAACSVGGEGNRGILLSLYREQSGAATKKVARDYPGMWEMLDQSRG
jgi:hypothetical protein